ncbi:long-chain-fatty-acid--CoA ligase [Lachnospiraceae bacterium KM106-2]|nr:long-chain-fatty-acid--CoA ligase [Lachnospiraceae bacterium KM106-2]
MAFYNEIDQYKEKLAFIDDKKNQFTYGQLSDAMEKIAAPIKKRTLVFSFSDNSIGSICGYLSFLNHKIVPLLVKHDLEEGLRTHLISVYEPSYLYVPADMKADFAECSVTYEGDGFCLLRTKYSDEVEMSDDLALLLTTSGSTGSPKLVRQSYKNIQANAESIAKYLELDATERPITTLPMNYTYGLSIINSHILVGATLLLTNATIIQKEFWSFFKELEATSFGGVPYTYEMLKRLRMFSMDLKSLRYMTQAGGKLAPELHKQFAQYAKDNQKKFIVMYGQTEATARMAYLPAEKSLEKYGSMGIAIPGGTLWLKDVNGEKITKPETVGELIYEGDNVTLGYALTKEDLKKEDERLGVLETGDMAKQDAEGFFYIVGRKKRFLKIFGNRVNLDEMEQMIKGNYLEYDCACTGRDDKLFAFITTKDRDKLSEIKSYLTQKTGLNPVAFAIRSIDKVPKNEAGKTLYKNLEEYL